MTKNLNRRSRYQFYNGIDIFPLFLFFATPRNPTQPQNATRNPKTQPRRNPATPRNSQLRAAGWVGWVWPARGRELRSPNGVAGLGGVAVWAPSLRLWRHQALRHYAFAPTHGHPDIVRGESALTRGILLEVGINCCAAQNSTSLRPFFHR